MRLCGRTGGMRMRSCRLEKVAMKHHNTREVMLCAPVAIGEGFRSREAPELV